MKLTFFGAAKAVTGSCHCLEVGGKKILIDCGLQQGRDERDNRVLDFAPDISTMSLSPMPTSTTPAAFPCWSSRASTARSLPPA